MGFEAPDTLASKLIYQTKLKVINQYFSIIFKLAVEGTGREQGGLFEVVRNVSVYPELTEKQQHFHVFVVNAPNKRRSSW